MASIRQIITERGGCTAVARALTERAGAKVAKTTVHAWFSKNRAPWWRMEMLMAVPVVVPAKRKRRTP